MDKGNNKTINLQEIFDNEQNKHKNSFGECWEDVTLDAMKEAIRQALQIAAENATIDRDCEIQRKSITDVINFIR